MRIRTWLCVFVCSFLQGLQARTTEETNVVIGVLVDAMRDCLLTADVLTETNGSVGQVSHRYADLTSVLNDSALAPGWSPGDRMNAIVCLFADLSRPDSDSSDATEQRERNAVSVLRFCETSGSTNMLGVANAVLSGRHSSVWEEMWDYVDMVGRPSLSINEVLGNALASMQTNVCDSVPMRLCLMNYCAKLKKSHQEGDAQIATNGAAVILSRLVVGVPVQDLDELLVKCYPSYSCSSNRLALAMTALPVHKVEGLDESFYFAPITNRLMSIQGPLPEVEELR